MSPPADWTAPSWTDVTDQHFDATPVSWETKLKFWEVLHRIIDTEPADPLLQPRLDGL